MVLPDVYMPIEIGTYLVGGLVGSMAKVILISDGHLLLPKIEFNNHGKATALYLGFLGNIILGVCVAVTIDHSFYMSVLASFSGGIILERLVQSILGIKLQKIKWTKKGW